MSNVSQGAAALAVGFMVKDKKNERYRDSSGATGLFGIWARNVRWTYFATRSLLGGLCSCGFKRVYHYVQCEHRHWVRRVFLASSQYHQKNWLIRGGYDYRSWLPLHRDRCFGFASAKQNISNSLTFLPEVKPPFHFISKLWKASAASDLA